MDTRIRLKTILLRFKYLIILLILISFVIGILVIVHNKTKETPEVIVKYDEEDLSTEREEDITSNEYPYSNCEGSGPVELSTSPMNLEDFAFITPYGLMVGAHVTPIDHQYFQPTSMNSPRDAYNVYAMAEGKIVEIQHRYEMTGDQNAKDVDEYRLVFMHTCTFYTYFDLVTSLIPDIKAEFDAQENNNYALLDIPVQEGQLIGYIGGQTLDFAVWNTDTQLKGFVIPEHYDSEWWKIHVDDPYKYYSDDLKVLLTKKNIRTVDPISGKIDYDVDGKLVGNWFVEGTNGYQGLGYSDYWKTHLSIVYDHLDPTAIIISIGDFNGEAKQYAVKGNSPNPSRVGIEDGLVKYDLVDFEYITSEGNSWDRMSWTKGLTLRQTSQEHGCVVLKMIEDRKLKMETFPEVSCSNVANFTTKAKIYER